MEHPVVTLCKFKVGSVELTEHSDLVRLRTQYDPELREDDRAFSDATPSGEAEITINNPKVRGRIKPGQTYLVQLEQVEG